MNEKALAGYLRAQGIELFAALPLSDCRIINGRRAASLPENGYVVFCAVPYYVDDKKRANVSMYARARDYHLFFSALFAGAVSLMREKYPGVAGFAGYADSSPFDERHGALAAGLGFIGRNGLLITQLYSSFVFIGELVLPLSEAQLASEGVALGEMCALCCPEGCTACRLACPVGLDKSVCLSAVTQKKTLASPAELDRAVYVWGCDTCSLCCPFTKKAAENGTLETPVEYFHSGRIPYVTYETLRAMTDMEFSKRAYSWRKKDVIERNCLIMQSRSEEGRKTDENM